MAKHYCVQCGLKVDSVRWAKGKRVCPTCGTARGLEEVILQGIFASLTFEQRRDMLVPYRVDSPEWTVLESLETLNEEE